MYRPADVEESRIGVQPEASHQHFERDEALHMREIGTVVVEAQRLLRAFAGARNPDEFRLTVDETLDQPGAREAIDPGRLARRPDSLLKARTLDPAPGALGQAPLAPPTHWRHCRPQ